MIFVDEYKSVFNTLMHPGDATKKSFDIVGGIVYYWKATLIPVVIFLLEIVFLSSIFVGLLGSVLGSAGSMLGFGGGAAVGGVLAAIVFGYWLIGIPIALLIDAAILQLFGKFIFKWFKGTYANTFSGLIYGATVELSLIWATPIGWLVGGIGAIITTLIGVANQNKTTWVYVLLTYIVVVIVVVILEAIAGVL